MKTKLIRNFFVIAGNLLQGNTLICSSSSNIRYIVDVVEIEETNRVFVKIHRPDSVHYLCSFGTSDISLTLEGVANIISHLISKYDL